MEKILGLHTQMRNEFEGLGCKIAIGGFLHTTMLDL